MNLVGGLDSPTEGTILVGGRDIPALRDGEPTGALDSEIGVMALKLLFSMAGEMGRTILIVTRRAAVRKKAVRTV